MAHKDGRRNFEDFDARMRRLRGDAGLDQSEPMSAQRPVGGMGLQVGIELVAGVVGGGLIGYVLDLWLGTWPALFIVLFFLGAAAGMLNAYRYIRRASEMPDETSKRG